jgi:endonuclease III-like uncharacterized protein
MDAGEGMPKRTLNERVRPYIVPVLSAVIPGSLWPGDTGLEIMIGSVLTRYPAWGTVEKALRFCRGHALFFCVG